LRTVSSPSSPRLLLAATVLSALLLPAGCFRSRLLKPKACPAGDPSCTSLPGKPDSATDGPRDAAGDNKRDGAAGAGGGGAGGGGAGGGGAGGAKLDGPLDRGRDLGGTGGQSRDGPADGPRDVLGDGRRDGPADGYRDGPADFKRDTFVCGPVEICGNGSDDDCNGLVDCFDRACMSDPACINRKQETCDNGIDDDGNGLVDCKDPACFGDKACTVPGKEICNNNLDDDGDGLTDCKDTDCATDPTCKVIPGDEICDNGKDDNGDGLADCTDPKCKTFPACLQAACVPDVDFGAIASSGASVTRTVTTTGATASYTTCAPPGGVARVGSFSLATAADVKLDFGQGSGMAHVVALFRAGVGQTCDRNPVECLAVGDKPTGTQTYTALAPGTYWLIVQSYAASSTGATKVTLSTGKPGTPEICNNGIDDDGDGAMDCADLDCAASSTCNLCVPDINLGTLVVGGGSKSATVDTTKGKNRYHPSKAGLSTGNDIVVHFAVRETVAVTLQTWQLSGQHAYGLFYMPAPGATCDDHEGGGSRLDGSYENMTWSYFAPGDYLLIYKALAAGQEGTLSITLTAYANRGQEICNNEIDDDGDQLVDCNDPDCASLPICVAPLCAPDGDLGDFDIGTRVSVPVDVAGATKVYRSDCGKGDGRGRAYRLNLLKPMDLSFSCTQTGDHVFQLTSPTGPLDACDAHPDNCVDPSIAGHGCSFGMPSLQPGVHYILVQAFASGDEGTVSLTLRGVQATVAEICNNGVDDNGDGAVDCDDRTCANDEICRNLRCRPDKTLGVLPLDGSPLSAALETSGAGDDQKKSKCVSAAGGQDALASFELPGATDLTVEWAQVGNHALVLYKADTLPLPCEANTLVDCHATAGATTGSYLLGKLAAGKYYLVVDADKAGSEGGVILQISGKPAAP
jgi:hypothetical protein